MDPIIDSLIPIIVQVFCNFAANKSQSLLRFKDEIENTKDKLGVMTSILEDAQKIRSTHPSYTNAKEILCQMREWVYDADDILLDCRIQAACESLSKRHRYTPRAISFRLNAANKLDQIYTRFHELWPNFQIIHNWAEECNRENSSTASTSHVLRADRIIGLQEETEEIIGYITGGKNSKLKEMCRTIIGYITGKEPLGKNSKCKEKRRIGIVGMGGWGKTAMAQKVFYDQRVVDHFQERIWVSVGQKFRRRAILTSMWKQIKQLPNDKSADIHEMSDEQIMQDVRKRLCSQNYLIVLDDVWGPDYPWWKSMSEFYLPDGTGSKKCIIITTRNANIATNMDVMYTQRTRELGEREGWNLFSEIAFSAKVNSNDRDFKKVGKEIVNKCRGFPLAIKTVAGLLSSKDQLHQWEEVRDNIHGEVAKYSDLLTSNIQLSYDNLSSELKNCILSFSIYPGDLEINAEQLVYWWIAEGFVPGDVKKAFERLKELVNSCLVEAVESGYDSRVHRCKIHDMMRDWIIKTSQEEKFNSYEEKEKAGVNTRHLGYTRDIEEKLLQNNSKLRTFVLMENCGLPSLRGSTLETIKSLRVLDLSQNKQESINAEDLLRWIRHQKRLAYLNLRGVRGLTDLPDWIKEHQHLQILVIRECINLRRLPSSITTLQNLIVLAVENCPLEELPRGLGKLTKLQVLCGFKFGTGKNGARLRDLKELKELRELGIKLCKEDDIVDDKEDNLSQLENLEVLSIDFRDCEQKLTKDCEQEEVALVNKLVPPPKLRELNLRSYPGATTPNWVCPTGLPELLYLCIEDSQLTGFSEDFWAGSRWKIVGLCFTQLPNFEMDLEGVCSQMERLRYVKKIECPKLDTIPCDVKTGIWRK